MTGLASKLGHEQNTPTNPGQFVGKRDRKNIAVRPLVGGLDPGLEPVCSSSVA